MIVTLIYEHPPPPHAAHTHNLEHVPLNYGPLMTAYFLLVCEDGGGVSELSLEALDLIPHHLIW